MEEELSHSGAVIGTPPYMAPEQAEGRSHDIGPGTDIYALAAILYDLLTGRPPFKGATTLETLQLVCSQEPVPPRRLQPGVPRDLETICLKCLNKDRRGRYATAEELAADLERFLNNEPIHARAAAPWERAWKWARRRPAAAFLVLVSVVALLGVGLGGLFYALLANELARLRREGAARTASPR